MDTKWQSRPGAARRSSALALLLLTLSLTFAHAHAADAIDLLQRYPATLTNGDNSAARARPWQFGTSDIFQLSKFQLRTATNLEIECGPADLGIGHCRDGVVWALLIPRGDGKITSPTTGQESISHLWLRFQPAGVARLFPPDTVQPGGATNLLSRMSAIARHKFPSSYHAGTNALIPDPATIIADADTPDGLRRFFIVTTTNQSATYVAAFEGMYFKPPPPITPALAETAFDQLWDYFDLSYAMFVLRPEVNWARMREQYRPRALACQSSDDFAEVCAEMLRPLRDLHISLTIAGTEIPVFDRPRVPNSNPPAHKAILGSLESVGRLQWAVTSDNIGFIGIYGWDDDSLTNQFPKVLEQMRATRSLIMDVRFNGGGNEYLAQQVAGRFVPKEFTYAYSQFRAEGPGYTNLTKKDPRIIAPLGPWRYEHPVMLLIGQKCMSSAESFVGMMTGDPEVTTMGDHTCGSSGNPKIYKLPLDMTVAVPVWIDYKPDGTPLDEKGFQPQIPFVPEPNAFAGKRDDLLTAALARLRK
jgi:hypothetical protein